MIPTNKAGRFVADLKPEGIEVHEGNNKPELSSLELKHVGHSAPVRPSNPAEAKLAGAVRRWAA